MSFKLDWGPNSIYDSYNPFSRKFEFNKSKFDAINNEPTTGELARRQKYSQNNYCSAKLPSMHLGKKPEGLVHILEVKKAYESSIRYSFLLYKYDLEFYVNEKGSKERILFFPITEDAEYFSRHNNGRFWLGSTTHDWVAYGLFYYDQGKLKFKSNYTHIRNKTKGQHNLTFHKTKDNLAKFVGTWKSGNYSGKLTWISKK